MPATAVERKWQMRRVGSGDYLLPSNDRETWWRLRRYDERDGSLSDGAGRVINGTFWSAWRWVGPDAPTLEMPCTSFARVNYWREEACMLPTRQAAIDYALSL